MNTLNTFRLYTRVHTEVPRGSLGDRATRKPRLLFLSPGRKCKGVRGGNGEIDDGIWRKTADRARALSAQITDALKERARAPKHLGRAALGGGRIGEMRIYGVPEITLETCADVNQLGTSPRSSPLFHPPPKSNISNGERRKSGDIRGEKDA